MAFELKSANFHHEGKIPRKHTCEGGDQSPPLSWTGVPEGTKSLALIVDDPDAPDPRAPRMTWVHWVVYNLPPATSELPAGVTDNALPSGARVGRNNWGRTGYGGPCPPVGRHRYFHKLYALDIVLPDMGSATKDAVELELRNHVLAQATLIGTYQKGDS